MSGELLIVGSIPVETAEQAFRQVGVPLGPWLDSMPDGEVGERGYWVVRMAYRVFHGHPEIETIARPAPDKDGVEWWKGRGWNDDFRFRVKPGVRTVRFGDPGWRLGFARDAVNAYAIFRSLKREGAMPQRVRFQVCLPPTHSSLGFFFPEPGDTEKVAPGLTAALRAEVAKIVELIPNDDLAIQWDMAFEHTLIMRKLKEGAAAAAAEAQRMAAPLGEIPIPNKVALGYHTCFGTFAGWPSRRPADLGAVVLLLNAALAAQGRNVDYVHIPTVDDSSEAFFAPLKDLKLDGTKIYIGAIHHLHGSDGLRRQLRIVRKHVPHFGLAAPCGWGRVLDRPETDRLLSDGSRKVHDPIEVILQDHKAAVEVLGEVLAN
jgi:hypothetical protein